MVARYVPPGRPGNGGKRKGAGRPHGAKNKRTEAAIKKAIASGDPLSHELMRQWALTGIMHFDKIKGSKDPEFERVPMELRITCAAQSANYYAARLSSVQMTGKEGGPIEYVQMSNAELKKLSDLELNTQIARLSGIPQRQLLTTADPKVYEKLLKGPAEGNG